MIINDDPYNEVDAETESELSELNIKKGRKRNNKKKKFQNINIYTKYDIILIILIIFICSFCIIFFINSINEKIDFNKEDNIFNVLENKTTDSFNKIKNDDNITKNNQKSHINQIEIKNIIIDNRTDNNTSIDKNRKITIAFVYSTLYANGIARFITLTANYFIETGRYDIYLITGKPGGSEYKFNNKIKRVYIHGNHTLIRNFTKSVKIDFFILQNVLGKNSVDFYRSIGKKVIGMFHGIYMSSMFHGYVSSYRNWDQFDYFDSYVFISYDDYFFYKKLGFKNEIFIPNLYTFEPSKIKSSNLTTHNIMMLGRAADKVKGFIYAVKAMPYIIKEVPDAILNIVSSNSNINFLKDYAKELNVTNNIIFNRFIENISEVFWNSSVFMYTSLSEAFPMAMNEAKAHGLPIVAFNVQYSIPYQSGVINVDMLDCEALANETIKLLKDYDYRKKMGDKAKLSLNQFSNNVTVELWGRLFDSLLEGEESYRKLQKEIELKYYNEERAREHMEKHYEDLLRYNKNFTCHTINNFTDINYIKNIEMCSDIRNNTNITNITNISDLKNNTNITNGTFQKVLI